MAFDYASAERARANYDQQVARLAREATSYRDRAAIATSTLDKDALLEAARGSDAQAEEARRLSKDMHQQIVKAQAAERALTFEELMANARERGKRRGRGDEGLETGDPN